MEPFKINGIEYTLRDDYIVVTGSDTDIVEACIIKSHVIDGKEYFVTAIGEKAFVARETLTSVSIPDSVDYIGHDAFWGCGNLTSITIPDSVTSIGKDAWVGCPLTKVVCKATIPPMCFGQSFYSSAFDHRTTTIVSVPAVSVEAYKNDELWSRFANIIAIEDKEPFVIEGIRYAIKEGHLEIIECDKDIVNATIISPQKIDGKEYFVTSIADSAFCGCKRLTDVVIPDTVTEIARSAFWRCESLTTISIPNGVVTIGEDAFRECSSLTSIDMPNSVTSIEKCAFYDCKSLSSIEIPDGVTTICNHVFSGCSDLKSVKIGDGVTEIDYFAFKGCRSLTNINIPNGVTSIGLGAFCWCTSIKSIHIPDSVSIIDNGVFDHCKSLEVVNIPQALTVIYSKVFSYCESLKSIHIPETVTKIDSGAFKMCHSLESLNIPNSVTYIGANAFDGCSSWKNIKIPENVSVIGSHAFGCTNLESAYIPASAISLENGIFAGCDNLNTIIVSADNPNYDSRDNCNAIIHIESNTLVSGCKNSIIPNTIVTIGHGAFFDCAIEKVDIPDSVTSIEWSAFGGCQKLSSVNIPNSVTHIGNEAFLSCHSLESIVISDSVTEIGKKTFYWCDSLKSVKLPEYLTTIGEEAFIDCSALQEIHFPASIKSIGREAFYRCHNLTLMTCKATIPPKLDKDACYRTLVITICVPKDSVEAYREAEVWRNYKNIVAIEESGNNEYKIGMQTFKIQGINYAFKEDHLEVVRCEMNVVNADIIKSHVIDGTEYFVTTIGDEAFKDCCALTSVNIPNSVTVIGENAFYGCHALTSVVIPNSVTDIGMGVFWNCESLVSITIPESITKVIGLLSRCDNLTEIICKAVIPPRCKALIHNFSKSPSYEDIILRVPAASIAAYRNAEGWKEIKNIVAIEEDTHE